MKGVIIDMPSGKPLADSGVVVMGFDQTRIVLTNAKGEYEVKFYDTTGAEPNTYNMPNGEIMICVGGDPNKCKTIHLKNTKIKKSTRVDLTTPPQVLKMNIKLDYYFEE